MDWFIERLSHTNLTLDYQDLLNHREDFNKLLGLNILKYSQNIDELMCEWCDEEHPVTLFTNSKNEIILSCSGNLRAVNPEELKIWDVNTAHFISLLLKSFGIDQAPPAENIVGLLWDLKTQKINEVSYHLFFCRNIDEIEKSKVSIITNLPNSVVFYTGIPHIALPNKVLLVPIIDLEGTHFLDTWLVCGVLKS